MKALIQERPSEQDMRVAADLLEEAYFAISDASVLALTQFHFRKAEKVIVQVLDSIEDMARMLGVLGPADGFPLKRAVRSGD